MRLPYLAQSYLLSGIGWDVPNYVARTAARQKLGNEHYMIRLQLRYGIAGAVLLCASLLSLMLGTGAGWSLTALVLLLGTVYFGIRVLRVPFLYQPVASSIGMQRAWSQLPSDNAVVLHVKEPLMIDYWDAVDPQKTLSLRARWHWHLREWLQR